MADLAVLGCEIKITSGQSSELIVVTTPPSTDNLVGVKGIYFGDIDVSLSAITQGNLTCASGKITISGTADNILNADGDKAVQEGDSGTATLTFTDSSSGATSPIPVTIEVKKAGQTDVTAT